MRLHDWNHSLDRLPESCDALVIGAGPAGSACAKLLADAGWSVVLADQHHFPREKVCGDGLVPDTLAALDRLRLRETVLAQARVTSLARCVAPSGQWIDVPGDMAVLPRLQLDALICEAAINAGAQMHAPARFVRPLRDSNERVIGAHLSDGLQGRDIRTRWLVLATGATPAALLAAGMCERRTPSAMALRAFVRHPTLAQKIDGLRFVWHPRIQGGYGWIFPGPDDVFNIGIGILDSHVHLSSEDRSSRKSRNLRTLFDEFLAIDPLAARLMREGESLGELKGAPLRCDLNGSRWSAPGILVAGEAAGTTYAFTGEGIGKAMESGMAAADSLIAFAQEAPSPQRDARVIENYGQRMQALRPRFELYRKAASLNRYPWMIELVVWRARHSRRLVSRLSDVLNERRMPGSLFSWRGMKRLILG